MHQVFPTALHMQRKILYLINPISGTGSKSKLIETIALLTNKAGIIYEMTDTCEKGDYLFLREKIKKDSITDVVIAGGDGTINQVVGALQGIQVRIGILPTGSGNGLAYAAGIPINTFKALQLIFKGKTNPCDGFMIKNKFGCMLAGLGFDAQVAADFQSQQRRGLITYIRLCWKNFWKAPGYTISLQFGGQLITREVLFVSIANSNQFGNKVTIAPKASLNDGLLDIVVVLKKNRFTTALTLLRQITAGKIKPHETLADEKSGILYFQTAEMYIDNPQLAPLHVDGEPVSSYSSLLVKVVPDAFQLIRP